MDLEESLNEQVGGGSGYRGGLGRYTMVIDVQCFNRQVGGRHKPRRAVPQRVGR